MTKAIPKTAILTTILVLLVPATSAAPYTTSMPYDLGLAYLDPTNTVMIGAAVCTTSTGGACVPVTVSEGDHLRVGITDNTFGRSAPFMVCIDTGFDGICRPELPDDYITVAGCVGGVSFFHDGPTGGLIIFVMSAYHDLPTNQVCLASSGMLDIELTPVDDQVEGWVPPPAVVN